MAAVLDCFNGYCTKNQKGYHCGLLTKGRNRRTRIRPVRVCTSCWKRLLTSSCPSVRDNWVAAGRIFGKLYVRGILLNSLHMELPIHSVVCLTTSEAPEFFWSVLVKRKCLPNRTEARSPLVAACIKVTIPAELFCLLYTPLDYLQRSLVYNLLISWLVARCSKFWVVERTVWYWQAKQADVSRTPGTDISPLSGVAFHGVFQLAVAVGRLLNYRATGIFWHGEILQLLATLIAFVPRI